MKLTTYADLIEIDKVLLIAACLEADEEAIKVFTDRTCYSLDFYLDVRDFLKAHRPTVLNYLQNSLQESFDTHILFF